MLLKAYYYCVYDGSTSDSVHRFLWIIIFSHHNFHRKTRWILMVYNMNNFSVLVLSFCSYKYICTTKPPTWHKSSCSCEFLKSNSVLLYSRYIITLWNHKNHVLISLRLLHLSMHAPFDFIIYSTLSLFVFITTHDYFLIYLQC